MGAPCANNDARIILLVSGVGFTIGGCADVESFCEHPAYGSTVQETCPVTCGSCARRLADGKDPNADELDWIEEVTIPQADELDRIDDLTAVVSPTFAPAAGIIQETEEFSNSDTKLVYP